MAGVEPAALLAAMDALAGPGRRVEASDRSRREAKHAVVLALSEAEVGLAMAADGPAVGAALQGGRVLWAFSDEEAGSSWRATRAPGTGAVGLQPVAGSKAELGRILERGGITTLLLNAAGPAGVAIHVTDEYRSASKPLIYHRPRPTTDPRLMGEGRARARQSTERVLAAAGTALAAHDFDTLDRAAAHLSEVAVWGDLARHAAGMDLIAASAAARGEPPPAVAAAALTCAMRWSDLGETARCAEQLLRSGQALATGLSRGAIGADERNPRRALAGVVELLDQLAGPDHAEAIADLRAVSEQHPAGP